MLSKILNRPVTLHGSGRTDAGVHALGQVANFHTDSNMDLGKMIKGLQSLLPHDIAIVKATEAEPDFHSRFSAKNRIYWYFIWNNPVISPFYCKYSWHIIRQLDIPAMRKAAGHLIGIHDFSSFQGSDKDDVNPVREVTGIRFKSTGQHITIFEIRASSFLKHMVRNIMGTLADAGAGKLTSGEFKEILEKKDRRLAGATAPPHGLFLKEVRY